MPVRHPQIIILATLALGAVPPSLASQYIYPANGQSAEQQRADEAECARWATGQTGHDPAKPASPPPQAEGAGGNVARGAARGALGAFAIGSVAGGDRSKAVVAGATLGGVGSGVKAGRSNKQAEQAHVNAQQAAQAEFTKARAVCLEGKGYTVK